MTVPITPGPFSFLAPAGQAVGGYLQGKEDYRQRRRAEAIQGVTMLLAMREKGLIPPEQFAHPEVQMLFQDAGISAPSAAPTPDEQVSALKGQYLGDLGKPANVAFPLESLGGPPAPKPVLRPSDRYTSEQRVAIGAPTQSQLLQERTALATGGATLPEAAPTALGKQQSEQDETYSKIADRIVESLYTRGTAKGVKKLPTVEEAVALGKADSRASVFKGAINEQYYGQAIERLRAKLRAEDIKEQAAANAYRLSYGMGGQPIDIKLVNAVNDMIKIADKKAEDMQKDVFLRVKLMNPTANAKDPQVLQLQRIQAFSEALTSINTKYAGGLATPQEIQALMQQASTLGIATPVPAGGTAGGKPDFTTRAQQLKKEGKSTEEAKKILRQEGYQFK